jgi:hypothetical protein
MMPKRGQYEYLITLVGRSTIDFLSSDDDYVEIVEYPCAGIDWRGCPNNLFTTEELADERGNIIVMF